LDFTCGGLDVLVELAPLLNRRNRTLREGKGCERINHITGAGLCRRSGT